MSTSSSYQLICGLEVHAELKTNSKMFCGCKNDPFGAEQPNTYTCPVCLGMPGALPVANRTAIEWTIKLGLALNCEINLHSKFDRKHYFYPDLPKGYQISQYDEPFCINGRIETEFGPVRIRRIHLEEDTAKLVHQKIDGENATLIDFNRSSVPLVEIVTEPDITSAAHAKAYAKELRKILRFLNIADCDMEQGGMRLEANTSLRPTGQTELPNYKVEVKNINSFRFLEKAIEYEMERQAELLDAGQTPPQETRGWNDAQGKTLAQRSKENAEDYRYFPDPDLPPMVFMKEQIEAWRAELPELPQAMAARWMKEWNFDAASAFLLTEEREVAEAVERNSREALKQNVQPFELYKAIVNKKISFSLSEDSAADVVKRFLDSTKTASIDDSVLTEAITTVLNENPDAVEKYRDGKVQIIGFLMGQVQRALGQKIDAQQLKTALENHLKA